MRVFVTGASGHVGSAVVPELLQAGHQVVALARSDRAAEAVAATGAEVVRGDLDDLEGLAAAARAADGVIHLAFKHDAMFAGDFEGAVAADLRAVETIGEALAGTGKPFVATTGTMLVAGVRQDGPATEADVLESGPRIDAENATIALAARGVRSSVVRLSPSVHSTRDTIGFVPALIGVARAQGASGYIGDGSNRWPAVHTLDAARLYRLALEHAPAGTRLHAVAEEGIPLRQIAEAIGRHLDLPVVSVPPAEAEAHFGFVEEFASGDNPCSSDLTRELLGWQPTHPGLLEDLEAGHYFEADAAH